MSYDPFNYQKGIERSLNRIFSLSSHKRDQLIKFYYFCVAEGLSKGRINRILQVLIRISNITNGISFERMNRDDIIKILAWIEEQDWSVYTKDTYKLIIKKFFRFYNKDVDFIHIRGRRRTIPRQLLTEEEMELMIKKANSKRNKAVISLLAETGCRAGELLNLKKEDIEFENNYARVCLHGKTNPRRLLVIRSVKYLKKYIDEQEPDTFFWKQDTEPMTHSCLNYIIKSTAKRCGITKKVSAELFRHSRATILAQHFTEAQLNAYMGWSPNSRMTSIYVQLSGRDLDDAIFKINQKTYCFKSNASIK